MGAGGLGEGDGYGGYRERLVETLRDKGIRDLAVLRAVRMVPENARFLPNPMKGSSHACASSQASHRSVVLYSICKW